MQSSVSTREVGTLSKPLYFEDLTVGQTFATGTVTVVARRVGDRTVLEVTDEGPGIPLDDRAHVFERFTTGGGADGAGGTGLGLAIARWVTQLHGGLIEVVEPDRPGQGCRIRATLPEGISA